MLPKNPWDFMIFRSPILILAELKSTKAVSISFDEKIIKKHQIESLEKASSYNNLYPGFVFNFREKDNKTYFVHIEDFIRFKEQTTRKSIPLDYIRDVGIEIRNEIKKVHYKYDLSGLFDRIIKEI